MAKAKPLSIANSLWGAQYHRFSVVSFVLFGSPFVCLGTACLVLLFVSLGYIIGLEKTLGAEALALGYVPSFLLFLLLSFLAQLGMGLNHFQMRSLPSSDILFTSGRKEKFLSVFVAILLAALLATLIGISFCKFTSLLEYFLPYITVKEMAVYYHGIPLTYWYLPLLFVPVMASGMFVGGPRLATLPLILVFWSMLPNSSIGIIWLNSLPFFAICLLVGTGWLLLVQVLEWKYYHCDLGAG